MGKIPEGGKRDIVNAPCVKRGELSYEFHLYCISAGYHQFILDCDPKSKQWFDSIMSTFPLDPSPFDKSPRSSCQAYVFVPQPQK
jgi:hypothetical protein